MTVSVRVVFADGTDRLVSEHDDLADATASAFDLADAHGRDKGDGAGPPDRIQVVAAGRVELSIRVFKGGVRPT